MTLSQTIKKLFLVAECMTERRTPSIINATRYGQEEELDFMLNRLSPRSPISCAPYITTAMSLARNNKIIRITSHT